MKKHIKLFIRTSVIFCLSLVTLQHFGMEEILNDSKNESQNMKEKDGDKKPKDTPISYFKDSNIKLQNGSKDKVFYLLIELIKNFYTGYLFWVKFEIGIPFFLSLANNLFCFETIKKKRFYSIGYILCFGYKWFPQLPILKNIIFDINICTYNWLISIAKILSIEMKSSLLKNLKFWKDIHNSIDLLTLIPLVISNIIKIDIHLDITFLDLSICIPITKILELIIIKKNKWKNMYETKEEKNSEIKYKEIYFKTAKDNNANDIISIVNAYKKERDDKIKIIDNFIDAKIKFSRLKNLITHEDKDPNMQIFN